MKQLNKKGNNMKKYYPTYFVSNEAMSLVLIEALNRKEAIERYAEIYKVKVSSYIVTKRPITNTEGYGYIIDKKVEMV